MAVFLATVAVLAWLVIAEVVGIQNLAAGTGIGVVIVVSLYLLYVLVVACENGTERGRIGVCIALFFGAALFWSGFEQAGSTFNLFAEANTDRMLFGTEIPASWLQSVNPLFIIILAPVVGSIWIRLATRNPSIPMKFFLGLVLLGVGFFVLSWGATYVDETKVGMQWLVVTYFFHSVGELCLSPVGLSSVTKLAPDRLVSQMMGLWFMGAAIGNLIAGLITGFMETMTQAEIYRIVAFNCVGAGLLFFLAAPLLNRMAKGIK